MTVHAKNLSCQGLQNVTDDSNGQLHWYGDPVIGYEDEMARRGGEAHVFGCELIGHRMDGAEVTV
jgi:hypothetical protein